MQRGASKKVHALTFGRDVDLRQDLLFKVSDVMSRLY